MKILGRKRATPKTEYSQSFYKKEELPAFLQERIKPILQEGEEAELVFIADLSLDGKFAEELLVVTGRRILNLSSLEQALPEVLAVDLEDIDNVALR
ncbi:MAG: hypothetical protein QM345_05145 [Bacillota bacterium]|nr:hypothetical protein [Bacillota bacterium]